MSKKAAQRPFSLLLILLFTFLHCNSQSGSDVKCHAAMDGHAIPLFGNYSSLNKQLLLYEDLNGIDTSIRSYVYEAGIFEKEHYTFTPQVVFIVNKKQPNKVIRQSFFYIINKSTKTGGINDHSLPVIAKNIGSQLPFLKNLQLSFGERKQVTLACGQCHIIVSKPKPLGSKKQELEITIEMTQ